MKKLRPENRHALIQLTAYYLYEKRGREPGHDIEDWVLAEALVEQSMERMTARELVEAYYEIES